MNKLVYSLMGFAVLVASMELSRTHEAATLQPTAAPTHVFTEAEQCAAVSSPVANCEAVLAGKMPPAPYADSSKLDFGRSDPQSSDLTILQSKPAQMSAADWESRRLQFNVDMAEYEVRNARRNLEIVKRGY
jgi:hypothetical protein